MIISRSELLEEEILSAVRQSGRPIFTLLASCNMDENRSGSTSKSKKKSKKESSKSTIARLKKENQELRNLLKRQEMLKGMEIPTAQSRIARTALLKSRGKGLPVINPKGTSSSSSIRVSRCVSLPDDPEVNVDGVTPNTSVKRTESSEIPISKTRPNPRISKRRVSIQLDMSKLNSSLEGSYISPKHSDDSYSSSSRYSVDPEDEQDLLDSDEDFHFESDGYPEERSGSFNYPPRKERDNQILFAKLNEIKKFIYASTNNLSYKRDTLNVLQEVEDLLYRELLQQIAVSQKPSIAEGGYGRLVEIDKISPQQVKKAQNVEINVRVDNTSLLSSNSSKNLKNETQATKKDALQVPRKNRALNRSNSCNHNLRDSSKNLIGSQTANDSTQRRYLTFTCLEGSDVKHLKCGHIFDILEWIVNTEHVEMEVDVFLFCFRIATTPQLVLQTLTILYKFSFNPKRCKQIIAMLRAWVKNYYVIDFHNNPQLSKKLWDFVDSSIPSQKKKFKKYPTSWKNKHWDLLDGDSVVTPCNFSFATPPVLLEMDPLGVAKQITLLEFEQFQRFNIFDTFCDEKPTSNATTQIVGQFNRMSGWVASVILAHNKPKKRALYICFFISLAKYLMELNNFNGTMEIASGLNSIAIDRLKKTWLIVQTVHSSQYLEFQRIAGIVSPTENFKHYRCLLKTITPPCLPFFGIVSRDVTLINTGNQTFMKSLLNFEKCQLLWKVCRNVLEFQRTPFPFPPDPMMQSFIANITPKSEQSLYDLSISREPIAH